MAATAGCQYGATLVRGIGRGFKRFTDWPCPCDPKMIRLWKSMEIYSADLSFGFQRSVMKVRPPPGGPIADAMTLDSWKVQTPLHRIQHRIQHLSNRNISKLVKSLKFMKFNEVHWSSWSVPFVSILAYFTRASSCTAHANLSMVNMFDFLLAGTLIG